MTTDPTASAAMLSLSADEVSRVLNWYAHAHSTGDPDEDARDDALADRFKATQRDWFTWLGVSNANKGAL